MSNFLQTPRYLFFDLPQNQWWYSDHFDRESTPDWPEHIRIVDIALGKVFQQDVGWKDIDFDCL